MAVKKWSRTVGDANFSTGANWSGGTVPVNNDSVEFDATSVLNCTIDALGTFNDNLSVLAGYTGVITQNINISIGVFVIADGTWTKTTQTFTTTTFTISAGTFNGGSGSMSTTAAGGVTFSGGTLTATSGTWTISVGSFTQTNSPTFTANGGTITFTGGTAATLTAPNLTFNIIDFNKTNVNFTVAAGTTCPLGTAPAADCGTGVFTVNGVVTWTNTFTLDSGISVSSTGTLTVSGTIGLSVGGILTFDPSATITASLPVTFAAGLACVITATAYTFGTCTITKTGGSVTVAAGTTVPLGTNAVSAVGTASATINGTVTVSGSWTVSATSAGSLTLTVSSTGTVSGALTTLELQSLGLNLDPAATFPSNVVLNFTLDITAVLTATAHTFATSIVNKGSGGFTLSASTALTVATGGTCTTWTVAGTLTLPDGASITSTSAFNISSGGTVTTPGTATVVNDLAATINAAATITGILNMTFNVTTAGSRTFAGGGKTFGTVRRIGSGAGTLVITGTNTFAGMVDNLGLVAHIITFPNVTTTLTGSNPFQVAGSAGKLVTLARTGGAGTFTLTASLGASAVVRSCDYLSISNSTVDASPVYYAGAGSTDGGGNTNWVFTAPPAIPKARKSVRIMT